MCPARPAPSYMSSRARPNPCGRSPGANSFVGATMNIPQCRERLQRRHQRLAASSPPVRAPGTPQQSSRLPVNTLPARRPSPRAPEPAGRAPFINRIPRQSVVKTAISTRTTLVLDQLASFPQDLRTGRCTQTPMNHQDVVIRLQLELCHTP